MSSFGTKEAWMEPMNVFLNSHRQEFKTYLDNICSISTTTSPAPHIPPSYSTPLAILQRLPPTSREGFPSLPYLIDHARNFAALVDLWLTNTRSTAMNIQETDGDLLLFHQICVALNQRTSDCLNRAERAERPSSTLSVKWEELVEQLQGSASFEMGRGAATKNRGTIKEEGSESMPASPGTIDEHASSSASTPVTMKPARPPKSRHQHASSISASAGSLASVNSNILPQAFPPKIARFRTLIERLRITTSLCIGICSGRNASRFKRWIAHGSTAVISTDAYPSLCLDWFLHLRQPKYPHQHVQSQQVWSLLTSTSQRWRTECRRFRPGQYTGGRRRNGTPGL
jgi:hypothetical protein